MNCADKDRGTNDRQPIRVKICGLMTKEDCAIVNRFHPDYVGFVFAATRHQVSDETAAMLRRALNPEIPAVGVFVDEPAEHIAALVAAGTIQVVQLHGHEDDAYIAGLREALRRIPAGSARNRVQADKETERGGRWRQDGEEMSISLIRAARVRDGSEILPAQALDTEFLLLDTYDPHVPGGSGKRFDLSVLPPLTKPWFLAGGLNPDNVREVLRETSARVKVGNGQRMPLAVDVSSGVESKTAGGHKDEEYVKRFLAEVRSYEQYE